MRRDRWLARADAAFFVLGGLASVWLAYLTLREGIGLGVQALLLLVFWVLVAYLVLPRLHRILTGVYVPDYFIGRARTADGLLGDPVNLALLGSAAQVHRAMERAGWTRADPLTTATGWRIVTSTLSRRSYPEAPVSPLFLFRRRQDFAYQQEVAGNPAQRHHVRFWHCPDGWLLPGGFAVDWLAAGTYDRSVGLSLFTFQVTHKIDREVDVERDHIVDGVATAIPETRVTVLPDFATGYHSRNGGGDLIETDGNLPILDLTALAVEEEARPALTPGATGLPAAAAIGGSVARAFSGGRHHSTVGRPSQTAFGVGVTALRALLYFGLAALAFAGSGGDAGMPASAQPMVALGVVYLAAGLADLALAVGVWVGSNAARLVLCALSLLEIGSVFVSRAIENQHGPLHLGLAPLAVSVLVLLALSSDAARVWASGRGRRRRVGLSAS